MKVGLVVHAGRDASVAAAQRAAHVLTGLGVDVVVASGQAPGEDAPGGLDDVGPPRRPGHFPEGLDLAVSFGGDGTFLRAAHLCRDADVPVLGVNLGRLGFLAEVEDDDLTAALRRVVAEGFEVEARATLAVRAFRPDGGLLATGWALNELALEKTARQRLLLMDVHLGTSLFARVPADAMIVASSTGSTAYALSAGGPIVSPRVPAALVVPVAPHTLFDRTVVASLDEDIRIELVAEQQAPAVVSCDGREPVVLEPGGWVSVRGDGRPVRLARVAPLDFYAVVRRKFGLR
ncbi:NAD(+)/NADH kinase [Egicoccus halophilus]|uniref:NAD kinase n=1 Tax=Egicoccus halophilus TaxID=1670830 RepID=A0A8J3ERG8_9ACTN|nr:NAD(+)/NADH kinase [Egicoccus halophilus]GGI04931.1 NAD kinase 2 [Egicoccus halophilus]